MYTITRRGLLESALAMAAAARQLGADPLGLPLGFQTWPVRDRLGRDFDGTLKQFAAMGYRRTEMCSPPGYAKSGFGALAGMKASEMRERIQAAGLRCESCHYQFRELRENLDERIAFAKELGLHQMVLSTFGLKPDAAMGDWSRAADELNRIGERVHQAGLQLGFHNHNFEFREIDGVLVYDALMQKLDPRLVKMQFQVAVISIGFKAADMMQKYPGRFLSLHLADWSAGRKQEVAIGSGDVDWKATFAAAKAAGVRNYFVEMNEDLMQASVPYLRKMA